MCKIRKIINNSAGDCSISFKFRTDFKHVTCDVTWIIKVSGSKVKVTAWHNVSAPKKRYNSDTYKLPKVKLRKNYPRAERNNDHKVKHWNRNNSAADPSIAFKFGKEFHHVTGDTLQMFKIQHQRSR